MEPEPHHHELQREILELTERVRRLEEALGVQRSVTPAPPDVPTRVATPERPVEPFALPPIAPVLSMAPDEPIVVEVHEPPRGADRTFEGLVGGKYYLAAGAIVVVIGIGLFLKLGYDQGWFRMADAWKCIWGAAFGLGLIAAGEVARRTINVWASTGLSAAGLGSLYLASYAAHGFYSLIGPVAAFVLLVLTSASGIAISVVARRAAVAVLAMLGAYLAPFLLDIDHPSPVVIPLHTLALLGVGLYLSAWKHDVYRVLRTIAWWGTVVLGTLWLASQGADRPLLTLPYVAIFWAAVHAELIASVRPREHAFAEGDAAEEGARPLVAWNSARHAVTSVSTSVWCVFAGIVTLRAQPILPDWFVPAGATVAAALLAMTLAGHLRVLRDSPRSDAQRLGAALAAQAGALLLTAVALAFSGSAEVVAWLALGTAAAAAGRWIGAPALAFYAVFPLAIAALRLVLYDVQTTRNAFTPTPVAGLVLDRWTLLMSLAAAAWAAAGVLSLRLRESHARAEGPPYFARDMFLDVMPTGAVGVGVALLLGSMYHPEASTGATAFVSVLVAVGVSLWSRRAPSLRLATIGLVTLVVAWGLWLSAYVSPGWGSVPARQWIHPGAAGGLAGVIAAAFLAAWHQRGSRDDRLHAPVLIAGAIILLWIITSLEVHRLAANFRAGPEAQHGALSVWWGLFAVALLAAGFRWRVAAARYAGLALLGVATLKALIIDLAEVSPGWRVVSVLGLGLLMLGVALVYARASARLLKAGA